MHYYAGRQPAGSAAFGAAFRPFRDLRIGSFFRGFHDGGWRREILSRIAHAAYSRVEMRIGTSVSIKHAIQFLFRNRDVFGFSGSHRQPEQPTELFVATSD